MILITGEIVCVAMSKKEELKMNKLGPYNDSTEVDFGNTLVSLET